MSYSDADLGNALAQCALFAADRPWASPDLLFALVPTSELAAAAPGLVDPADASALSPVLQETDPEADLEALLATLAWPGQVAGCALVTEITVQSPDDPEQTQRARLIAGALRGGRRLALLSLESLPDELRTHPELAPDLLGALAATFE
ncbi:PPA1309 family protein [Gordonia sp. VNK21]|uniref:PPA1309 family protein n=1 Tax=Gordonia sp. VNK21 TaxID=3382483 RepID=UPI0038D3A203